MTGITFTKKRGGVVKYFPKKVIFTLIAALALGVGLHFLFHWLPSPITALISPVHESLWEHLKILLIPLLLSGLYLTHSRGLDGLAPWLLTLPIIGGAMLLIGYVYHIPLQGDWVGFDLILYVVLMVAGFVLAQVLTPLTQRPGIPTLCLVAALALAWLMIWFTFFPPDMALFLDLSQSKPTFYILPK